MVDFTVIIVPVVISMAVTIAITLCCRCFPDHIETFLNSMPESLSENITKLRDKAGKIRKMNHPKKDIWLLKVDRILGEGRKLLPREYSSSTHSGDDRRSYFFFGHCDSSPIKLQRQVKRLIVEGERIMVEGTPGVPIMVEGTTPLPPVQQSCDVPDIEKGPTVEEPLELKVNQIRPHNKGGSTVDESSGQAGVRISGVPDIAEGTSNRKHMELEHVGGFSDIERGIPSSQHTEEGSTVAESLEQESTVDETLEQASVRLSDVPASGEGTGTGKTLEHEQAGGVPGIEKGISEKRPAERVQIFPRIGEGSSKDKKWEQTADYEDYGRDLEQETWKQKVVYIDGVPNIEDYETMRRTLSEVMDMLGDNGIRKIGIWGPGGAGKTTLVRALTKKLNGTSSSSLTLSLDILVSITWDVDPNNMQKAIAAELKLNMEEGMDTKEAANQIHQELQRKKFLLILDDVWECIDLSSIGIPENQLGSKIVLTTRSLEVCNTMEAEAIKMNYLTDYEAWKLFSEQVRGAVDAQRIRPLAEEVCKECGGLPQALVYVGSSMRGKSYSSQWQDAVEKLENSFPFNDSVLQVYNFLKLSYDSLKDDNLKSCFLYCSLYPKRSHINIRELVECWLAENLIDNNLDYVDAVSMGLEWIGKLMNCSLLEAVGEGRDRGGIVMNAMVANVARWIAQSEGKSLVFSGYGNSKSPDVTLPEEVDRLKWISFVENNNVKLTENVTQFPSATTVIFDNYTEEAVLRKFLQGFGALRVLRIKDEQIFPVSLSNLKSAELRALLLPMGFITEGKIEELAYVQNLIIIDISGSYVRKLPRGMEQLPNLKVLNLSYTCDLVSIDPDILCSLEKLEVLDMRGSSYKWSTKKRDGRSKNATLQDLSRLTGLKAVYVELADVIGNYEEFKWIEKLKSSLFYYGYEPYGSFEEQMRKKIIFIPHKSTAEIGSFIFHAENLILHECTIYKGLLKFPTSEDSISRLKSLRLEDCFFFDELTETAPNSSILSNLKDLQLSCINDEIESFSKITDALGNTLPELTSLDVERSWPRKQHLPLYIQHIKLPKLEKITLRDFKYFKEIFHCNTAETPAAFPNLRILELHDLMELKSLSDYEWNDQWNRLEILIVIGCPNLKKLPRMSSIKEIRGSVEWWNSLEWDDEETRSFMNQHFKPRQMQRFGRHSFTLFDDDSE